MYFVAFMVSFLSIIGQLVLPVFITDLGVVALISLGLLAIVCVYAITCHVSTKKLKKIKSTLMASLVLLLICVCFMAVPYFISLSENYKVTILCYVLGVIEWVIYANCVYKAVK